MAARTKRTFLNLEEQIAHWHDWKDGDKNAGEKIYLSYELFIHKIARGFSMHHGGVDPQEMFLAAREGFFYAMKKYNPEKRTTIGTYSEDWMKVYMNEALRQIRSGPKRTSKGQEVVREVYSRLEKSLEWKTPLSQIYADVAQQLQMKPTSVQRYFEKATRRTVSLDYKPLGEDGDTLGSMIPDVQTDPLESMQRQDASDVLNNALSQLDDRSQTILKRRFGMIATPQEAEENKGATLETVGGEFGVSKERIRQLENRAMERLREIMASLDMHSFDSV